MGNKNLRGNRKGLYDPQFEHDACGVGFIADLNNRQTHDTVKNGIEILKNLDHRGAVGAEHNSGDGAGILIQMPHEFLKKECDAIGISLPERGRYGAGITFLPQNKNSREKIKANFEKMTQEMGLTLLGWRDVPTNNATLGSMVKEVEPFMAQVFVAASDDIADEDTLERKLYILRKWAKREVWRSGIEDATDYFVISLSCRTMTYKGMLTTGQMPEYFPDLHDKTMKSAIALVHSRFSTNTFPSWPLAQPFRFLAHNGEINTLRGNVNWMKAREAIFESDLFSEDDIKKLNPLIDETQSDSAILDTAVELLYLSGRSLPHVMAMLIPEAWASDTEMDDKKRAFYEYHATIMEPWDGPASIGFTDGKIIGATLDRNGLRPSRYQLTKDNILVMASEAGVLKFPDEDIIKKGWLQPGRMFVAVLDENGGRIIPDKEIKEQLASEHPYGEWLDAGKLELRDIPKVHSPHQPDNATIVHRQSVYGFTAEDIDTILIPMVNGAKEPIGSMGSDTPLAVLSDRPQPLFNYFYQLFAQVTNPPIDPLREESVMSLVSFIGDAGPILSGGKEHCHVIELPQPILTNHQLERLRRVNIRHYRAETIPTVFDPSSGDDAMEKALSVICKKAADAVDEGKNIIILSDRPSDVYNVPIPSLLAVAAVHHHLIREGKRTKCGIIIETGEALEVHHFALLLGYGASAINPFLAFETIEGLRQDGQLKSGLDMNSARVNFMEAVYKGLLKIMSKMGISTIQSYIGAQIFEAVGLSEDVIDRYFTGTASRLGGIGIETIQEESMVRHRYAYPEESDAGKVRLELGGVYAWRARGEHHTYSPEVIHLLQRSTRLQNYEMFKQYTAKIDDQTVDMNTIRGLLDYKDTEPIPIDEVEPVESITKRFFSGAMSFGSISKEAHETLAIAMNRVGARSNSGEGGESVERFTPKANGDSARSAIKQVASGRFGVTSHYLVNADEIQIKMAQGAKPGEGGHLPGSKVDKVIAGVRHSTPGVGLISPPPHHDIYSIEDLAQLIFDLKNANNKAEISVKLVSEVGVGTIAAGVAKGHSELILISGHDGGTGASPYSSIKHAGLPWELGVAETHQVLMRNDLRDRIVLQADGRIMTGRDVAIATLLGAESWGMASSALVVSGCVMMRKCHMNSCPVGIATQDKELRKNYTGDAQYLVNFYRFLAEEMRENMALLGFRTVEEMVGRVEKLKLRDNITHWKAKQLNVDRLLDVAQSRGCKPYRCQPQDFGLDSAIDNGLIEQAKPAIEKGEKVTISLDIKNVNRTTGTMLSAEVSRKYGEEALPEDTIVINAKGTGGQSFSAFGAKGVTFNIEGEVNDYFGKGLSGSKLVLSPPKSVPAGFVAAENVICGNVAFYGATSGEAYINGMAGERFCVRNSGAKVVVESVGDNGCEYMTGGRVVILGSIGKNFAAGMSGGIAYISDPKKEYAGRINMEMVDLETIEEGIEADEICCMLKKHSETTGSATAKAMLDSWDTAKAGFIKVMPRDYKRALAEMAAETAATGTESN